MRTVLLMTAFLLWASLTPPPCAAADTVAPPSKPAQPNDKRYFEDRERGWFWRELDPEPEQPAPADAPPLPSPPAVSSAPAPAPPPLSVEWLREELEKAKIAAINDPTPENVEWHSYLVRLSLDRAKKFAEAAVEVNAMNPYLDGSASRQLSSYGRLWEEQDMQEKRVALVRRVAGDLGIWYFYASSCDYCARMNPALNTFATAYGMPVLAISLDGKPPRDGFWPDFVVDRGQGAHLQIKQTPTLYLFKPPNRLIFFGVGVQTMTMLEKRLLRVAEKEGWITPEEKRYAVRGLRGRYLLDAVEEISTSVDWSNREEALRALREASTFGVEHGTTDGLDLKGLEGLVGEGGKQ